MQTPKLWQFEDLTTTGDFSKYSSNLGDLVTLYSGCNFADCGHEIYNGAAATVFTQHTRRYLYYQNKSHNEAAMIHSWTDPSQTYSLADIADGNGGLVDLEQEISWLAPGMFYTITDVAYAWETEVV